MNNKYRMILKEGYRREIWKQIILDGVKTVYLISNYGRVKNINIDNYLKPWANHRGYYSVDIRHNGKRLKSMQVHRLVALHFLSNPEDKSTVNHIDGDKSHNEVWNLEWATSQENSQHAVDTGLRIYNTRGEQNTQSKYTTDQIVRVCEFMEEGKLSNKEIAEATGVSIGCIKHVRSGQSWTHISNRYNFKNRNFLSEDTIHMICLMLANGEKIREITIKTGASVSLIHNIKFGLSHTSISKLYNISNS